MRHSERPAHAAKGNSGLPWKIPLKEWSITETLRAELNYPRPELAAAVHRRIARLGAMLTDVGKLLGAMALLASLSGCGGGGSGVGLVAPTGQTLYVATLAAITEYPTGTLGNIAPSAVVSGSNTMLSLPVGIAVDSLARLYVADARAASISVFAAGANGNVAPTTRIAGVNTGLRSPQGIAVDSSFNIYVADDGVNGGAGAVFMFAAGSNGNVAPSATLAGSSTGLDVPVGIALFSGALSVSNFDASTVAVYALSGLGNVTPMATISGSLTTLNGPAGIFIDPVGNTWIANRNSDTVTEYPSRSHGNVSPITTIGGPFTAIVGPEGIALDRAGDIFVSSENDSVLEFPPGSNGNIVPSAVLFGPNTELNGPQLLFIN